MTNARDLRQWLPLPSIRRQQRRRRGHPVNHQVGGRPVRSSITAHFHKEVVYASFWGKVVTPLALEMQISALTGSNCVWCADLIVLVPTGVIPTCLLLEEGILFCQKFDKTLAMYSSGILCK